MALFKLNCRDGGTLIFQFVQLGSHSAGMEFGSEELKPDLKLAKTGVEIAGASGYPCVACHAAGEISALQAIEGQGQNL